jgi:hypothetical protein
MKNTVVLINLKNGIDENPEFVDNCILSWKSWCEKNNVSFFILDEKTHEFSEMPPQMQKMYTLDTLMGNGIEFDQIAQVDYDTFILPHCPNFFKLTNHEFGAGLDSGFGPQLNRSIQMCKNNWFPDSKISWDCYFNSGFIVYNQKHKKIFKDVLNFYNTQKEKWLEVNKSTTLTDDQTLLNFFIEKNGFPIYWFPRSYNVLDPWNRYFFYDATDELGRYINNVQTIKECINIFHFCGDINYRNQSTEFLKEKFL